MYGSNAYETLDALDKSCSRPACSRTPTFLWVVLAFISLCCRADLAGVTSYVCVLGFDDRAYDRFLHLFYSKGRDLD
jgi:hypothetical protein